MQNSCSYYYLLWIKRSYLLFLENAWKNFLSKFTFNIVTFQVFSSTILFYLDSKLLLLWDFGFPRALFFRTWETIVLMIFFTFLGCLSCQNLRLKFWAWCLWGKIKSMTQHLVVGLFQTWSWKSVLVFLWNMQVA